MFETIKCNLCGAEQYSVIYRKQDIAEKLSYPKEYQITEAALPVPEQIVKCLRCGLIYVSHRDKAKVLLDKYRNMVDESYIEEESCRRLSARIFLKAISHLKRKSGKILEIGCTAGFLLDEARKYGWGVYGVELSEWAAKYAKEKFNLDVINADFNETNFPNKFFDVVVMRDTIEHLIDPKQTLAKIRKILKLDGLLCISTPDINSLPSRILRARWWGINRYHLFYFTKKTLKKMLKVAGFKVIKVSSYARIFSLRYWTKRLEAYRTFVYDILRFLTRFEFLKHKLIKINLRDQMVIFAQKSRKLIYLEEDEEKVEKYGIDKKKKVVVVLPAYNAAKTLKLTVKDIPRDIVDEIILVDDASSDNTVEIARQLRLEVFVHPRNKGYGANQKTCYTKALEGGADIVVMVHPDYQYDPKIIPELVTSLQNENVDAAFGSRMMKGGTLEGGMPLWKHNANILLTAIENIILGTYLTEYHSGFRAYSAYLLKTIRFMDNSDGFIFDTEIIVQALIHNFKIGEIPIRTRYFNEASTIKFLPSLFYGLGILKTMFKYILHTHGIIRYKQFE